MLQYRCNINYYYFAKIGWKNFQEDRGSWNRRNAKRLAIDRKHADKRITGHAGQGQMRRRVTAGRLGKLGLTLFALAGVFFSLFASVLDPVVLDDGVLLAAAEPDAGDAADWAADYDWYTLDEAGEKVPYDISAAVTAELELYVQDAARAADATTVLFYAAIDGTWTVVAQKSVSRTTTVFGGWNGGRYYLTLEELEEVYGPYGFDADSYQGQRFFPHLDSAEREQRVWADVTPRIDADDGYWIPLGTIGRASNSVYYTPENTEGSASYFTEFKKYTDPQLLADSTLYTVEVKDHSGAFFAADLPETRYVPNGQPFTIVLPLAEGVHWAVADPLTGETLDLTGVEDAESQTLTYTVPAASHPYRFSAHSDQKVIVYEAGLSGALVDLSNELVVGT